MPKARDAEEGRGKLRKATVRRKHPSIRGYPNGGTPRKGFRDRSNPEATRRSETSQYPEEKKSKRCPE